jgi:hypothetical protein
VLAASTLPVLFGGDAGESEDEADEMFERWTTALALPTVRGIVAGRALLYPLTRRRRRRDRAAHPDRRHPGTTWAPNRRDRVEGRAV